MSIREKEFNSPQDLDHVQLELLLPPELERQPTVAEKAIMPGILLGDWVNVNPATRGLVMVELAMSAGKLTVHPHGACVPMPCDWGRQPGIAYAANVQASAPCAFSATFSFTFKDTLMTGKLQGALLAVETYNHFKDGSSRSDFCSRELFRRV